MTASPVAGGPDDAILGAVPQRTYWPERTDECARVLADERGAVGFIGGASQLALGGPPSALDAVVRTQRMARILDYAPADMVIVAEAGVTLAQVQATARAEGQMLALDAPEPERATIGGLVATAGFGPRRARYGAIRDLVLGITLVRADGVIARSGGRVVKNVAGFDLPKLACGSLGTLGLIAEATFRLHPLPPASATVRFAGLAAARVVELVARARDAQLELSSAVALRAADGRYDLGMRFEGFAQGVRAQAARMAELGAASPEIDEAGAFWREHDLARTTGLLRVKLAALPTQLPAVEAAVIPVLGALRGGRFAWYASLGIGFVAGDLDDAGAASGALIAARAALIALRGSLVIEASPPALRSIDPWGPAPAAFALMTELKRRFDPSGRLNPGRFLGGL